MKINPTSQCLSLIIRSMEQILIPELTSQVAKSSGSQIKLQLEDLVKDREKQLRLCGTWLRKGTNWPPPLRQKSAQITASSRRVGDFDALAADHAKLTTLLDEACQGLRCLTLTSTQAAKLQQDMAIWEYSYYNKMSSIRPKLFENSDLPSPQDKTLHRSDDPALSAKFLQSFLTQRHGPTKVQSFNLLPGGFGKQKYFSTVTWQNGQTEELVIRKMDAVPIMLHRQFLLGREFDLVTLVHKTGYICPQPIDLGWDVPGLDGNFYTMKRIRGKIPGSFPEGKKEAISESLLLHCAELLAQLQSTPLEPVRDHVERFIGPGVADDTVEQRLHRLLGSWNEYRTQIGHLPSPFQTFAFDWLRRNVPRDTQRPVLVHGDFGIHNMLSVDDRITAVL